MLLTSFLLNAVQFFILLFGKKSTNVLRNVSNETTVTLAGSEKLGKKEMFLKCWLTRTQYCYF